MQLTSPGQTIGIVNPDGTVTQISPQQVASVSASTAQQMKPVTSIANQSQITQLSQAGATQINQGGIAYSIIPAQQIQNISIDGQEAIAYIPASSFGTGGQTFQIAGTNQIFQQSNLNQQNQSVVRTSTGQTTPTTQQTVIQGLNNLTQLGGGQTVAIRQGNTIMQVPINSLQQTVPVQVPMQTQNGQTIYQTMQLPLSTLSSLTGQQVIQQMPQQIQMVVPQQTSSGEKDNQSNNQSQVNNNQQASNQNIIATINLPNGQLGQLISAPQAQAVWPTNALNLSNLSNLTGN